MRISQTILSKSEALHEKCVSEISNWEGVPDEYIVDLASLKRCINEIKDGDKPKNVAQAKRIAKYYIKKIESHWNENQPNR